MCRRYSSYCKWWSRKFAHKTHSQENGIHNRKTDKNGNLAFFKMNITENSFKKLNCVRYRKQADTGVDPKFCSCAPTKHKEKTVEGTVQRIFGRTSTWQSFDIVLKEKEIICLKTNTLKVRLLEPSMKFYKIIWVNLNCVVIASNYNRAEHVTSERR